MTDAHNAMGRLISVFTADTLEETFLVDLEAKEALLVDNASFTWETSSKPDPAPQGKKGSSKKENLKPMEEKASEALDNTPVDPPSTILNISLAVPRGSLVIVCGPVGSGKSSLLQGLIGEMRKTSGEVRFGTLVLWANWRGCAHNRSPGGSVAYCAQTPWIQNTSVRENVVSSVTVHFCHTV